MAFFGIMNCTSGPDLKYECSYTSIIRLGLAAGDTPDATNNRLGTRGPSNSPKFPTCFTKIGRHTRILSGSEDHVGPRRTPDDSDPTCWRILPRYVFPYSENPRTIRLSLFTQQNPRRSRRGSRTPEISAPPYRLSPSINTRFAPSFYTHSFLHTFAHSLYCARTFPRSLFTQRLRKERSRVGPRTTSAREDPLTTPTRRAGESFLDTSFLIQRILGRYDFPCLRNKIPEDHGEDLARPRSPLHPTDLVPL
ncbi:hypothetical protein F511_37589 [Dorcoceras hygrometricum]|uniref:Uncharacterized protein n=1 Tax=Dorcoceras hygrometricum TaxID=472368 RepID=A0A2Z7AP60_9LAMI|nr:hypothetical protein F511_37589 [Dorcoceras hygrometricum]